MSHNDLRRGGSWLHEIDARLILEPMERPYNGVAFLITTGLYSQQLAGSRLGLIYRMRFRDQSHDGVRAQTGVISIATLSIRHVKCCTTLSMSRFLTE